MRSPPKLDSLSYSDAVWAVECLEYFNFAPLFEEDLAICDILNLNIFCES